MRSGYVFKEELLHILAALMPANRLALELSLSTGLRIGDVLSIKTADVKERFTVLEQKTGKRKAVYLNKETLKRVRDIAGHRFVFASRCDGNKHRSRQAVYKDLRRACDMFRIKTHISPHTARKVYAVEKLKQFGSVKRVQALLNHSDEAVTMLYAMADVLETRRL